MPHPLPPPVADPPAAARVSAATREALQLPQLLAVLAARAASDLGREKLLALRPSTDEDDLRRRRHRHEEAERLVVERPLVPVFEQPVAPVVSALVEGEPGGREMVAIGELLRAADDARERIMAADPACAALAAVVAELPSLAPLAEAIDRALDSRGMVRDDASPELVRLRARIRGARDRLYGELSSYVDRNRDHLSEDTIPLRDGRLVLLLQAGARGRLDGLTHGRSGRGKSFYFEPLETVELNNRLQQAADDEEAERRRIFAELVRRVRAAAADVAAAAELVAELDRLQVAVRYGQAIGGRLAELAPRRRLALAGARHPLLDPALAAWRHEALGTAGHEEAVVPLEVDLDDERRVLIVTGPNAGGKTVALKTVGLLVLSHLCGLPVPAAAGSRLPFFDAVVATVGDDQDLLADRSTFSGRLLRLREAWELAGPDALVLLDELGSGTDPEEGAALSVALIEALVERGCLALATTHLVRVAAAALELDGAFCAAMAFDVASGQPTYSLRIGPPGGSEALALARRLGLPAVWLTRAEALLGGEHRELRRLLEEVEEARRELEDERRALAGERADAERLRRRLAQREAELAEERKKVGRRSRSELESFRQQVQEKLRDELALLERSAASSAAKRRAAVGEAVGRLFAKAPEVAAEEPEDAGPPVVGGEVRHRQLGWLGTLEKLDRGKAQVRVGGKVLRCGEGDLVAVAGPPRRGPKKAKKARVASPDLADETPRELKLIGQRVEPALEELDRVLDRALLAGAAELRVVHGHGSGQLRRAVREHLRHHPAVATHRPGDRREGGDGATVVSLRG